MSKGGVVSLVLALAGCAPAASPVDADRKETGAPKDEPSRPEPVAETSGLPAGFRECFAEPSSIQPPFGEKPLPPGVASWIREIDAAMPRVVDRSKEPIVVVPLAAGDDRRAEVPVTEARYGAARTLFEHQHWGAAALRYREIALNHPEDVGIYAAQLYLECLNVVGARSKPERPRCFEAIRTENQRFLAIYCSASKRAENRETCTMFETIEKEIERRGP